MYPREITLIILLIGTGTAAYTRMVFTLECLEDLDQSYKKLGLRLFTFQGKPTEIFDMLIKVKPRFLKSSLKKITKDPHIF